METRSVQVYLTWYIIIYGVYDDVNLKLYSVYTAAIVMLKKCKSPCCEQIPAEVIQVESETLAAAIQKLINSIWNKKELPDQWKESIIVSIHKRMIKL
jgi:hypothetical protein